MNQNKTFIYFLHDPENYSKGYIGRSRSPKSRFQKHISDDKLSTWTPTFKRTWIRSLLNKGLRPIMMIIDEVDNLDGNFWERHYVSLFRSWGFELKNSTDGGDGSIIGNKSSFKKGGIPWNKGKTDYLSEDAKKRMGWTRGLKGIKTNNKGFIPSNKGTTQTDPPETKERIKSTQFKKGNYPARWLKSP